jgi:ParB-like chromosome segregation protein Spo0J
LENWEVNNDSARTVIPLRAADTAHPVGALRTSAPVMLPISEVLPGDSPRLAGEDPEHVRLLAALQDLPPILVHRGTMRVIDGMHRLRAARLRGDRTICAEFFEGDDDAAFLLAVDANIKHGLPLSLADREAAAGRILGIYQHWSDRAIAAATGLSPTTVSTIRRRSGGPAGGQGARVGRDGRVRPVDGAAGRLRASGVIARRPDASLRDIAREARVSVGTARDVRERLRAGRDPVLTSQRDTDTESGPSADGAAEPQPRGMGGVPLRVDWQSLQAKLSRDPAVKYADSGRAFVRWMEGHVVEPAEWAGLIDAVPPHWRNSVAEVARSCARAWLELARDLEQKGAGAS